MKRVFEGKFFTKSSKTAGGIVKTMRLYKACVDFLDCLVPNRSFRITVEPLPESKPEPKNCGNCVNCEGYGKPCLSDADGLSCFKPKPAEPQGWEQRFDTFWKSYADKEDVLYTWNNCQRRKDELLSFIRAEIERVHAGYAPLICAIEMAFKEADFLPDGRLTRRARAVFEPIRKAEQDRRGEGKQ